MLEYEGLIDRLVRAQDIQIVGAMLADLPPRDPEALVGGVAGQLGEPLRIGAEDPDCTRGAIGAFPGRQEQISRSPGRFRLVQLPSPAILSAA